MMRRLLVPLLAVALLGTAFTRVPENPTTVHVRWTARYHDLVASTDQDIPAIQQSGANTAVFPLGENAARAAGAQHGRAVVAGRTLLDRALTRDEQRQLGFGVRWLRRADVDAGGGEHDFTGAGTATLQYRASPPGYRIVPTKAAPTPEHPSRRTGCDRTGSFESVRTASRAGTTARLVQRGDLTTCIMTWPSEMRMEIVSDGRHAYVEHHTFTKREQLSLPTVVGALQILDGPAFVDLDGTGSPSIMLTGGTGGMHCCYRTQVFYPRARSYGEAVHTWGNGASYPVLVHDARSRNVLFGSSNDAFAWAYGSYADAVEPVQIYSFERGRFRDVTPDFPDLLRS